MKFYFINVTKASSELKMVAYLALGEGEHLTRILSIVEKLDHVFNFCFHCLCRLTKTLATDVVNKDIMKRVEAGKTLAIKTYGTDESGKLIRRGKEDEEETS